MMKNLMCVLILIPCGWTLTAPSLANGLADGKLLVNLRFRMEHVDQDPLGKNSFAVTLRTRLGYETAEYRGFRLMLEMENITDFGWDNYNNTKNGSVNRPVIADPKDTEVNRLQLHYAPDDRHKLILGRQRIILGNARFVGNVGWRQNEQTFDALRYLGKWGKTRVDLIYLNNINRIFGEHHPVLSDIRLDGYLANIALTPLPGMNLSAFSHWLDFQNGSNAYRVQGLSAKGQWPPKADRAFLYEGAYAKQDDFKDGSAIIDADYYWASVGAKLDRFSVVVALETLGGDGRFGFATPLATLHAFNGWADVFLNTPAAGLQDLMLRAQYQTGDWKGLFVYHRFESDSGSGRYGDEYDLLVTRKLSGRLNCGFKAAFYDAEDFASDRHKLWGWVQYVW